jgi:hypothetical protein
LKAKRLPLPKRDWRQFGVKIHPELHTALHKRCVDRREPMCDRLHRILCRELKRPDLLRPPEDR